MNSLLHDYSTGILGNVQPPCLSLYQPTHRHHPGNQQDLIRFRNLLKEMELSLRKNYPAHNPRSVLRPFEELAQNLDFWNHTLDGLAAFAAPDRFRVYNLARPVRELSIVAESFHIKPLIRFLQTADRYQVLGVGREKINFFEGNQDVLNEVELDPAVPRIPSEAPKREAKELLLSTWASSAGDPGVHFSKGSKSKIEDNAATRFLRAVDRAILEHYSRPTRLPLILAALPENQSFFRSITRNPFLLPDEVTVHPDALTIDALRERAWVAMEPHYCTRLAGLVEMFGTARAKELGDDHLESVAASAVAARVATLLTEADRHIPGRIDPETGAIVLGGNAVDDVLDDIAELVLKYGGQVVIVPSEQMPTRTGIAAIYRY
ncbi:MAG: hypothetical protein HS101_19685 [Planctomycetia bacterium]|jgi:hypothetical protein|nr:hypothetical protein [Planctomycetia bacterium]MCC7316380.1 hypothetical protein [Planctomycetota bacterium]OQY98332.1 MAG: hypothetical protein B6D36_17680 [Planctomycetes bacterium UTPLA1]